MIVLKSQSSRKIEFIRPDAWRKSRRSRSLSSVRPLPSEMPLPTVFGDQCDSKDKKFFSSRQSCRDSPTHLCQSGYVKWRSKLSAAPSPLIRASNSVPLRWLASARLPSPESTDQHCTRQWPKPPWLENLVTADSSFSLDQR